MKELICDNCNCAVDFDEKEGTYYCFFYEGTVEPHETCDCHEPRTGKEQQWHLERRKKRSESIFKNTGKTVEIIH